MQLFEDAEDRMAMLKIMGDAAAATQLAYIAWCLMGNHLHLLVSARHEALSKGMWRVAFLYARHYNAKHGHTGHVFQSRFWSEPIETEAYLLDAVRYIHLNPQAAGLDSMSQYPWSSYREYIDGACEIADTGVVLGILHGVAEFEEFHRRPGPPRLLCGNSVLRDDVAREIIHQVLDDGLVARVRALPRSLRDACLGTMKALGCTQRQVCRLTGIGLSIVRRAFDAAPFERGDALRGQLAAVLKFLGSAAAVP